MLHTSKMARFCIKKHSIEQYNPPQIYKYISLYCIGFPLFLLYPKIKRRHNLCVKMLNQVAKLEAAALLVSGSFFKTVRRSWTVLLFLLRSLVTGKRKTLMLFYYNAVLQNPCFENLSIYIQKISNKQKTGNLNS